MEPKRVSGKQLTVMTVAICGAVVLAPVGVYAAAHSTVSIVDGKHPSRAASVTAAGAQVVTGSMSVKGSPSVTVKNTPYVRVLGEPTVVSDPGSAHAPLVESLTVGAGGVTGAFVVPTRATLVLTTISVRSIVANGDHPQDSIDVNDGGDNYFTIPTTSQGATGSGDELFTGTEDVYVTAGNGAKVSGLSTVSGGATNTTVFTIAGYDDFY